MQGTGVYGEESRERTDQPALTGKIRLYNGLIVMMNTLVSALKIVQITTNDSNKKFIDTEVLQSEITKLKIQY